MTRYFRKRKRSAVTQRYAKRPRYARPSRSVRVSGIHHFRRTATPNDVTGGAIGNISFGAFGYNINQLPNVSEFINLFDHFRINAVVSKFYLQIDPAATNTQTSAVIPRMYWVKDYNDSAAPVDIATLRQYNNMRQRTLNPYRPITIKVRPAVLTNMYEGVATTAYSPKWKCWIDTNDPATPHFALKWAIENFPTGYTVKVEHTFYISCKNVR